MLLWAVRNHSRGVSTICVLPESVADLRQLDRAACVVVCGAVRCRRGNRCTFCQCDTVATCFKIDGRQDTTKSRAWMERETTKCECTRHTSTLDSAGLPRLVRDVALLDSDSPLLGHIHRAAAMPIPRCAVSTRAESLEGAMNGHAAWAVVCR